MEARAHYDNRALEEWLKAFMSLGNNAYSHFLASSYRQNEAPYVCYFHEKKPKDVMQGEFDL